MASSRVAHATLKGPNAVKEIVIGIVLGCAAGSVWTMHHWNEQRKVRAFMTCWIKARSLWLLQMNKYSTAVPPRLTLSLTLCISVSIYYIDLPRFTTASAVHYPIHSLPPQFTTTSAALSSTPFLIDAATGHRLTYIASLEQIHSISLLLHFAILLLQLLCNGMDENAVGTCAELIFAPIDASLAGDAPLLPSGFRIILLDLCKENSSPSRTLDSLLLLKLRQQEIKASIGDAVISGATRSVMPIAFQFAFESQMQEKFTTLAQHVCSIISSVQRLTLALSPSHLGTHGGLGSPCGTPEAHVLARWICQSYR
ncbi:unnamed protein product [Fraxinus pennsylvanica]|uniref:Uncharacterized protein n=1 Tax=Fraxinus pennsylvanica TaxID=56036 RepID=A0AAD2E1E5_9LAMI|nr:unnamed protein product [Fraxinus pennsylvanica]